MLDFDLGKISTAENPIFIFSSGQRTGSTLLQRLLNSCPSLLIWGEHGGYLHGLFKDNRKLVEWEKRQSHYRAIFQQEGYDSFVPNLMPDSEEVREALVLHLYALFGIPAGKLGHPIWGFKEVRYGAEVALTLQSCFPNARFIHLTRHVVDCFISMKRWENTEGIHWERSWTKTSIANWAAINRSFYQLGSGLSHLLSVKYEDIIADPIGFTHRLAAFLEMPVDSFDTGVYTNRIHGPGSEGRQVRQDQILPAQLDEEEKAILSRPNVRRAAQLYGYSVTF